MRKITKNEIDATLAEQAGRVYLAGKLEKSQGLFTAYTTEDYEIGISKYDSFKCEKPHLHKSNHEYNYVVSGEVKVYFIDDKQEEHFSAGDLFVIEPGEQYIGKAKAGTLVIFSKDPGGNDKVYLDESTITLPPGWKDLWDPADDETNNDSQNHLESWKKKGKRWASTAKQGIALAVKDLSTWISVLFAVFSVVSSALLKLQEAFVVGWLIFLFFCVALVVIRAHHYFSQLNFAPIKIRRRDHDFIIMKGDFVDNFDSVAKNDKEIPVLVIGIDTTLDLELSTSSGVLRAMTDALESKYGLPQNEFQRRIDEAYELELRKSRIENKEALPLEEFLFVKQIPVNVENDKKTGNFITKNIDILFIANSRKKYLDGYSREEILERKDDIEPADHRKVTLKLFDHCRKEEIQEIMIGAIGTNGGKTPYPVIITDIINGFALACLEDKYLKKVILSMRLEDIENQNYEQCKLISLINERLKRQNVSVDVKKKS